MPTKQKTVEIPPIPPDADLSYILEGLRPLAVPIDAIKEDPENARQHPTRNMSAIQASIVRYGQRKPVVVNKLTGIIEAGNGTWRSMKAEGYEYIAALLVEDDPVSAVGYAISDNRTAELAEWDYETLGPQLRALLEAEEGVIGWESFELEPIINAEWRPANEEAGALDSNSSQGGDQAGHALVLTEEQWGTVNAAVQRAREVAEDPNLSFGRCLELICADYIAGAGYPISGDQEEDEGEGFDDTPQDQEDVA